MSKVIFLKIRSIFLVCILALLLFILCSCSMSNNSLDKQKLNIKTDDLELCEKSSLSIVVAPGYKPYEYIEDGVLTGFDIDLSKKFAQVLGLDNKYIQLRFDSLIDYMKNGNDFDLVISGLIDLPERQEYLNFSQPYLSNREELIMLARANTSIDKTNYSSVLNNGGKVAVGAGSSFKKYIDENFPGANIVAYETREEALQALNDNKVLAVLADSELFNMVEDINKYIKLEDSYIEENICVGVPKNKPNLLDAVNKIIDACNSDSSINELKSKYF